MVVHSQFVRPGDSWAFCLSFALQLALVLQVPVGSLLTYGSHPSRWGHPCGVEAIVRSERRFGVFSLSLWAGRGCCALSPYGWASNLCLRLLFAPCPTGCFLEVLATAESLRLSLALSSVLPCPMLWLHVRLHHPCSGPEVVLGALPLILPDGVRASVRGSSLRPAAAGAFFPGCPR